MYKISLLVMIAFLFLGFLNAYSQQPQLATFQEMAQVIIDQHLANTVTASITLQSTSNQEIRIPSELETKIRNNDRIISVIVTNVEQCVLGVQNEACILVNVSRDESEKGIIAIQDSVKEIGNSIIDDINQVFDTNAEFHSVFVHHLDEANVILETSGVVSGKGTVSAVYTMPNEDTKSMYEKISSILLPSIIRNSGGFYEIAKNLSSSDASIMTVSIIPNQNSVLYQIKVSVNYLDSALNDNEINPLNFLETDKLERSSYFSDGFYPLNSLLHVIILSAESTNVSSVNTNIIPTEIVGGDKIPKDLSIDGWIFDPESGTKIDGRYLFGNQITVSKNDLIFTLGPTNILEDSPNERLDFDESVIIIIIVVVAAGAVAFYLKGYKK